MRTVRNSQTYDYQQEVYEINRMPSMTVPDQSMSVQEIMQRYAQGLPLMGERVSIWQGDVGDGDEDYLPDPQHLDLAEREELERQFTEERNEIERKKIRHNAWKKAETAKKQAEDTEAKQNKKRSGQISEAKQGSEADDKS